MGTFLRALLNIIGRKGTISNINYSIIFITQQELSNEYQHDRVLMVFKNLCILVLWMKAASAVEEV